MSLQRTKKVIKTVQEMKDGEYCLCLKAYMTVLALIFV